MDSQEIDMVRRIVRMDGPLELLGAIGAECISQAKETQGAESKRWEDDGYYILGTKRQLSKKT